MPGQISTLLEPTVRRMLERLDALDFDSLGPMLTDDAQIVDEITRGWTRGRAAVGDHLGQLKDTVSDVDSKMTDAHEAEWDDVGLVTFVLDQTYQLDGQQQTISAPTSILLRREDDDWKIALIHTVPIPG